MLAPLSPCLRTCPHRCRAVRGSYGTGAQAAKRAVGWQLGCVPLRPDGYSVRLIHSSPHIPPCALACCRTLALVRSEHGHPGTGQKSQPRGRIGPCRPPPEHRSYREPVRPPAACGEAFHPCPPARARGARCRSLCSWVARSPRRARTKTTTHVRLPARFALLTKGQLADSAAAAARAAGASKLCCNMLQHTLHTPDPTPVTLPKTCQLLVFLQHWPKLVRMPVSQDSSIRA